MTEVVREGFLCPVCLEDLGDVEELQNHVRLSHAAEGDEVLAQLRGLFGKAKQRLKALDSLSLPFASTDAGPDAAPLQHPRLSPPPELGPSRNHTATFKQLRDTHVNQAAIETNTLIIRLDKLLSTGPTEPGSKRRAFEKGVSPWMADSDSKHCTLCLSRFNPVSRRKHHCRLCGRLTCADCSRFLHFLAARKLTNPAFAAGYESADPSAVSNAADSVSRGSGSGGGSPARRKADALLSATLSLIKRDGSEQSFSSILSSEGEDELRVCGRCKSLLDRRDEQMERGSEASVVVVLYDRLRSLISQATQLLPTYQRMAHSILNGESLYTLQAAKDIKTKILRLQEQIDTVR